MDNNFNSASELSMSQISAFSNARETSEKPKNLLSILALIMMIVFVLGLVGISVINFGSFATQESTRVVNAQSVHNTDVEKLTNQ